MKKLLSILFLLISVNAIGQDNEIPYATLISRDSLPIYIGLGTLEAHELPPYINLQQQRVESRYDTTLLFKGIDTVEHIHNYVSKSNRQNTSWSCGVYHGILGCPNGWLNEDIICTICLRNETVIETRKLIPIDDPYKTAKDRLNKIKK